MNPAGDPSPAVSTANGVPMHDLDPIVIKPRRKNVVSIEAPPEVRALSLVLGQSDEQFVGEAVQKHVEALKAKMLGVML